MFQPFVWMFKAKDFKSHCFYLFKTQIIFFILGLFFCTIAVPLQDTNPLLSPLSAICGIICLIIPGLFLQGYFWELTENIINRKTDIESSSVYNGKIKEVYTIELPPKKTRKFIWRGIASVFATILLFLPFMILIASTTASTTMAMDFFDVDNLTLIPLYAGAYMFIGLFIPGLLWNYASRNSVVAVWNIFKAIHLMGTFPVRYILNTVMFLAFMFVYHLILQAAMFIFGINSSSIVADIGYDSIRIVLYIGFVYLSYIYCVFVNSYLLGTIAPSGEE